MDIRTQSASGDGVRTSRCSVPERVAQLMFQLHGNMLQTGKSGST